MKMPKMLLIAMAATALIAPAAQAEVIAFTDFDSPDVGEPNMTFDNALPEGISSLTDITWQGDRGFSFESSPASPDGGNYVKGLMTNVGGGVISEGYVFSFVVDPGYSVSDLQIDYDIYSNKPGGTTTASYSIDGGVNWIDILSAENTSQNNWTEHTDTLGGLSLTGTVDIGIFGTQANNSQFNIDGIELAATIVPEPATMSLLALGGLAVLRRRRR